MWLYWDRRSFPLRALLPFFRLSAVRPGEIPFPLWVAGDGCCSRRAVGLITKTKTTLCDRKHTKKNKPGLCVSKIAAARAVYRELIGSPWENSNFIYVWFFFYIYSFLLVLAYVGPFLPYFWSREPYNRVDGYAGIQIPQIKSKFDKVSVAKQRYPLFYKCYTFFIYF